MNKNYLPKFATSKVDTIDFFWGSNISSYNFSYIFYLVDNICPICHSKVRNKTKGDICSHAFCYECILSWVKINNICPACKSRIMKLEKI